METTGKKISIVNWNKPEDLKIFDKDIVCVTANKKIMPLKATQVARDWKWLCDKYNIKYWCLTSELVPNFEKNDGD